MELQGIQKDIEKLKQWRDGNGAKGAEKRLQELEWKDENRYSKCFGIKKVEEVKEEIAKKEGEQLQKKHFLIAQSIQTIVLIVMLAGLVVSL